MGSYFIRFVGGPLADFCWNLFFHLWIIRKKKVMEEEDHNNEIILLLLWFSFIFYWSFSLFDQMNTPETSWIYSKIY